MCKINVVNFIQYNLYDTLVYKSYKYEYYYNIAPIVEIRKDIYIGLILIKIIKYSANTLIHVYGIYVVYFMQYDDTYNIFVNKLYRYKYIRNIVDIFGYMYLVGILYVYLNIYYDLLHFISNNFHVQSEKHLYLLIILSKALVLIDAPTREAEALQPENHLFNYPSQPHPGLSF